MRLTEKDKVSIAQDPKNPRDWYVFKDNKTGFSLSARTKSGGSRFNCTNAVQDIKTCISAEIDQDKSIVIPIATVPIS